MSKRKLNLKDLKVSSFVTSMENDIEKTVKGGARDRKGTVNTVDICYAPTKNPADCFIGADPGPGPVPTKVTVCVYCYTVENGAAC